MEALNEFRQKDGKPETGGILIGYRRGIHLHVVKCTYPFSKDRSSLFRFFRQDPQHKKIAIDFWRQTNKKGYYIGEWHTHPQDFPASSSVDNETWTKLTRSSLGPDLLFLIVGRKDWYLQLDQEELQRVHVPERNSPGYPRNPLDC